MSIAKEELHVSRHTIEQSCVDVWDLTFNGLEWLTLPASTDSCTQLTLSPSWPTSHHSSALSQDAIAAGQEIDSIVSELWRSAVSIKNNSESTEVSKTFHQDESQITKQPETYNQSILTPLKVHSVDDNRSKISSNSSILVKRSEFRIAEKKFECDECQRSYNWHSDLVKHKKVHSDKRHVCSECGKSYPLQSDLIKHQRVHKPEKDFLCKHCGKTFTTKGDMCKHVRIHTGEKPFVCELCKKSFSASDNLSKHVRTHSGLKPVSCLQCGQKFLKRSNLVQHNRIHTGEKPFVCDLCGLGFSQKTHLTNHKSTHSGKKPHQCVICGQRFTRNRDLNRHNYRVHKTHFESRGLL